MITGINQLKMSKCTILKEFIVLLAEKNPESRIVLVKPRFAIKLKLAKADTKMGVKTDKTGHTDMVKIKWMLLRYLN